jgi:hypothetical protein
MKSVFEAANFNFKLISRTDVKTGIETPVLACPHLVGAVRHVEVDWPEEFIEGLAGLMPEIQEARKHGWDGKMCYCEPCYKATARLMAELQKMEQTRDH